MTIFLQPTTLAKTTKRIFDVQMDDKPLDDDDDKFAIPDGEPSEMSQDQDSNLEQQNDISAVEENMMQNSVGEEERKKRKCSWIG